MNDALIVYYSFSGSTRRLAEEIAARTGGRLRALVPETPYSFSHNAAAKEARAQVERGYCPPLREGDEPIDAFDVVFVGTPNWFRSMAPPVRSFLSHHDFAGKTVVPFCTHGGGGWGRIVEQMREACGGAAMRPGIDVQGDASPYDVAVWLRDIL